MTLLVMVVGCLVAIPLIVIIIMKVLVPIFQGIGWVIRHVFRFIGGEIGDALRMVGCVVTASVLSPMILFSVLLGRWSASAHYGRAFKSEVRTLGVCGYRCLVGHPARLLGLSAVTDGIERRIPQVVAAAPGPDRPGKRLGQFEGYRIVGSLAGGGSGGKLYVAEPDAVRLAAFERAGHAAVSRVVIKVFSTGDGSSLPQIIRESRALEAAKKLGLILDHDLSDDRFFYVMKYIPGESLGLVTQRLHAASGPGGLGRSQLSTTLGIARDLLSTLDAYHQGGLWHKDVKPDNIIIEGARAHLVDLGLVTPMRSAMTLTTHGTEYFRDSEMVRMALKGVKVHQVNGAKFDVYAAGAVLYSMIENSFPAHGGLSQISKSCPESLRWIVRRAMTEYDKRYASAREMADDIAVVAAASDPFAVRPADLPSVRGGIASIPEPAIPMEAMAASPAPRVQPLPTPDPLREPSGASADDTGQEPRFAGAPRLRVTNWLTGRYEPEMPREVRGTPRPPRAPAGMPGFRGIELDLPFMKMVAGMGGKADSPRPGTPDPGRRSAAEQLSAARARASAARQRAHARMRSRARPGANYASGLNSGIGGALLLASIAFVAIFWWATNGRRPVEHARHASIPEAPTPEFPEPPSTIRIADVLPAPAPEVGVLVLDDVSANLPDESRREVVRAALARLKDAGFVLMGNFPGTTATGEQLDTELRLAAEARRRVAQMPLDSEETREELQGWLSEQEGTLLALWVRGEPDGPTEFRLFAPQADGRTIARDAQTLGRIITIADDAVSPFPARPNE